MNTMDTCMLCKQEFTIRGLKEHYHKKQSCVSQKFILQLYKNLHQVLKYKKDILLLHTDLQPSLTTIESIISVVQLPPEQYVVRKFSDENTTIVKEKFHLIEKAGEKGFRLYVNLLHCNPKLSENRNIKITSMSGLYGKIYQNENWELVSFEDIMMKLLNNFWEFMKNSEHDSIQDYLLVVFEIVIKKESKTTREFMLACKKNILPLLYNATKADPPYNELLHNNHKKKLIKRILP